MFFTNDLSHIQNIKLSSFIKRLNLPKVYVLLVNHTYGNNKLRDILLLLSMQIQLYFKMNTFSSHNLTGYLYLDNI